MRWGSISLENESRKQILWHQLRLSVFNGGPWEIIIYSPLTIIAFYME